MAGAKVNTKFVFILGAGLVAVLGGLLGAAYLVLYNTAGELVQKGDRAMASQDYREAATYYSKACDREKTNAEYFRKWRSSIAAQTPDTPVKYQEALQGYRGATRQLAVIQRDSVEAQREYLEMLKKGIFAGPFDRQSVSYLRDEAGVFLAFHAGKPAGDWEVLRRYRGLANARLLAQSPDAKPEDWASVREDLEAAIRVDPSDFESVSNLEGTLLELSDRARVAGREDEASSLQQAANAVVTAYQAANPDDPIMQLATLRRDFLNEVRAFQRRSREAVDAGQTPPDPVVAAEQFTNEARGRLDRAMEVCRRLDAKDLTPELMNLMRASEQVVDGAGRFARSKELLTRALEARPDDLEALSGQAEVAAQTGDYDAGIQYLQKIIDQPNRPVSPEGGALFGYRDSARYLQALWALRAYLALDAETPEAQREASLKRARAFHDVFTKSEAPESVRRMMVDAWLAFVDRDPQTTNRLLTGVNKKTPISDPDTLVLWAQAALQTNEPGAARERLLRVLDIQPNNISAGIVYGQLSLQLQDFAQAETTFSNILRLQPDNQLAQNGLNFARAGRGADDAGSPVQRAILTAVRMQREGVGKPETDGQVNLFLTEQVEKNNHDPLLVRALVTTRLGLGDREGAMKVVRTAMEKHPDSVLLKDIQTTLTSEDPTDAQLTIIASRTDVPELQRRLARHSVFTRAGRADEARAELAELVKLDPDGEQVLELQFLDALARQDWDAASALADKAGKLNTDRAEGRTFRARMLAARGDPRAGADIMQQVIDAGGASPEVFRLHGRLLSAIGRHADALASYQAALRLRPNDAGSIRDVVASLVTQGRRDQALVAARDGAKFAENDPEFLDLWLRIEAEFGNLPMVLTRRERLAAANPRDRENLIELARLQIRTGELEKARTVIDQVRAQGDDLDGASLDASWHWARNDRAGTFRVFDAYVESRSAAPDKLRALLDFAQFLYARQDVPNALGVLEKARAVQDPATLEADKAMAEAYFAQNALEQGVEVMRRILAAKADSPEQSYRKRLVESLIRLKRVDEAETELAPLLAKDPDLVAQLLEADLRLAQEKPAEARLALDRIVSRFPAEPSVFVKRGQLLMRTPETHRDALADFGKAIQLQPQMWQAFRLRAALHGRMKNSDAALADLREAMRINPTDDEMLVSLVTDLLRLGRDQEAEQAAEDAIAGRPREALVFSRVASLFSQTDRPAIAAKFYEKAFDLDPSDLVSQKLLDSLINTPTPNLAKAEDVLRRIGSERIGKSPGFMMALGKLRAAQGRVPEAQRAALDAVRLLNPENGQIMMVWHEDMQRLITNPTRYTEFLEASIRNGVVPQLNEWLAFFAGEVKSRQPGQQEAALADLARLRDSKNQALRAYVLRLNGSLLFQAGRVQEAKDVWVIALREFPADPEMNNNLAYVLAKEEKFTEALPLAETAVRGLPNNADIIDTLGYIRMRLNKLTDAELAFRSALSYVRTAQQGVQVGAHLAECLHLLGRTDESRKILTEVDAVLASERANIQPDALAEYERVKKMVETP
ncbi:MAG: tetratricopeptide repeat protein [Planctomycetota bacterium]|nr:tetratricopeptide repeat protein [Planctomycetota bacterium]